MGIPIGLELQCFEGWYQNSQRWDHNASAYRNKARIPRFWRITSEKQCVQKKNGPEFKRLGG